MLFYPHTSGDEPGVWLCNNISFFNNYPTSVGMNLKKGFWIIMYNQIFLNNNGNDSIEPEIRAAAVTLHSRLRECKIEEADKPIFAGTVLVALNDKELENLDILNFHDTNQLIYRIMISFFREIRKYSSGQYGDAIWTQFMRAATKIGNELPKIVSDLANVHRKFDCVHSINTMEIFFHEFLSGSSAKKLSGIVLTPTHIADFMAHAIEIDRNSHVLDICCGTGAFFVAATECVSKDTENNADFCGCEVDSTMQKMAVLTTTLNACGSDIKILGDCFDENTVKILQKGVYNKGLINPPFAHKNHNEFDFMLHELSFLEKHGELAVLCPVGCAIGVKFHTERYEIMKHHTLKAVFSMPPSLFAGNGAQINTCVMVWEAKVPHDPSKKTFLGFFQEDGLRRCGKKGRGDLDGKWHKIEQEWLHLYFNQIEKQGVSLCRSVSYEDEWLYEAYAGSSNLNLSKQDFERTLLDYLQYCLSTYGALNIGG